jgi:thiol:disulfide interchange protein DsbD
MKTNIKYFILLIFPFISYSIGAQNHVQWEVAFDDKQSEIVIKANIDPTWHLYSIHANESLGPVPTLFTFSKTRGARYRGKIRETQAIDAFDPNFGANIPYHEKQAEFRQKVKVRKRVKELQFTVLYMVCDDEQCLPPIEITLNIKF